MNNPDDLTPTLRQVHSVPILIGAMIVLVLLGFARLYTDTQEIQRTQAAMAVAVVAACQSRNASRIQTNHDELAPLRASLTYLADEVLQAAAKQTGSRKARSVAFADRYLSYAADVLPYALLQCTNPTSQGGKT